MPGILFYFYILIFNKSFNFRNRKKKIGVEVQTRNVFPVQIQNHLVFHNHLSYE